MLRNKNINGQCNECIQFIDRIHCHNFLFRRAHITTRNVVERSYGLLKRRFPILHSGMQHCRMELIQKVIGVCCIFHNICIDMGDTDVDDFPIIPDIAGGEDQPPPQPQAPAARARLARDEIVQTFAIRLLD